MKTFNKLFAFISLAILGGAASVQAQDKVGDQTTVIVVGDPQNEIIKLEAIDIFAKSLRQGPQQMGMPRFMITDKKSRAVFAIGGFVNFRTYYDFNNVIGNIDFETYDIPMTATPANAQRFGMDGSTSRLYFKTMINTKSVGAIQAYIETDFRGQGNSLRLREAYISMKGFTIGQTTTTFCDLAATPNTIDFEGPNGYTYGRNLMVQYKKAWNSGISIGVAAEMPTISATAGANAEIIPQRIPDIPAYVQYAWSKGKSHVRVSGIMRNMTYYDKLEQETQNAMGWGAQASGIFRVVPSLTLYGQFLYGQGITPYIQDLSGHGLDLTPDHEKTGRLISPETTAWLVGLQYNITPKMPLTLGYSQVNLTNRGGYSQPMEYRAAQYVVANLFYNISPSFWVGAEYLYGTRIDQNDHLGRSNRIQLAAQFSF